MQEFQKMKTMLQIASDIHNWESEHMKELETMSGRFIVLNLVNYFCKNNPNTASTSPLKSIYRTDNISEKSIRNKLKEFNLNGLIRYTNLKSDGRSKCAIPTDEMINRLINYSEQINIIIRNHFYLVEIQNQSTEKTNTYLHNKREATDLENNLRFFISDDMSNKLLTPNQCLSGKNQKIVKAFEI